jgi:hypothetical protein
MWWQEIDSPGDLEAARKAYANVDGLSVRSNPLTARASSL